MDAYKDSVEFVNSDTEAAAQIIGNHDIIPAEVAAKAIPECSIVFMEGDEMQTILSGYLNTLNEQNPETIGGQLPDEDFYYKTLIRQKNIGYFIKLWQLPYGLWYGS